MNWHRHARGKVMMQEKVNCRASDVHPREFKRHGGHVTERKREGGAGGKGRNTKAREKPWVPTATLRVKRLMVWGPQGGVGW